MDLTLQYLLAWAIFLSLIGYVLPFIKGKTTARIIAWLIIILTTIFSIKVSAGEPALFRMIAIVSLQLLAMKSIVMVETYSGKPRLNFIQWLAFELGWFGMRPVLFEQFIAKPLAGVASLVGKGVSRILFGAFLLYLSERIENQAFDKLFLSELMMLAGLSFILHFGILNLSAALWRLFGVDVKALFLSPYLSKSLKEFWGKRWNMAFSEMTALVAYKPLKNSFGNKPAMFCSFLLSGLLHEIAISCPVNSGYGLPLSYFVIHGLVMFAEGEWGWVKKIINHPWLSRVWVFGWLILPMPLLFHKDFIAFVVMPLRNAILSVL